MLALGQKTTDSTVFTRQIKKKKKKDIRFVYISVFPLNRWVKKSDLYKALYVVKLYLINQLTILGEFFGGAGLVEPHLAILRG